MKRSFLPKAIDFLRNRKRAYQATFVPGTPAHTAFTDLGRFCGAFKSGVAPGNADQVMFMAGQRAAFFRIWQHLNLEPDELAVLYRAVEIPQGE